MNKSPEQQIFENFPHQLDDLGLDYEATLAALRAANERNALMRAHQKFRADAFAYALSNDDFDGLVDFTLKRLLELSSCDYIAIHTVDGDHRLLYPHEELRECPGRCEDCAFYKFEVPQPENSDNLITLTSAQEQTVAPLGPTCPAKSLEAVLVYRDGKVWGGIALHYLDQQYEISEDDRETLKITADVLTLALERKSAAEKLRAERDRAVAAEQAKTVFFSSVSHDIRTPLNAIIGFSELLEAGDVPPEEAKRDLEMIRTSGKTLLQLINDLLDLSKLEAGKMDIHREPTDFTKLATDLVPVFRPMLDKSAQKLQLQLGKMPTLMLDPLRLRQILFNLIGNAIKYAGPTATIRLEAAYANGVFSFAVVDDGRGLSSEEAAKLLLPFAQADNAKRGEGTGLGLAICKQLIERSKGSVTIETAPGKGFAFRAKIPAEVAVGGTGVHGVPALPTAQPPNSPSFQLPRRVLVVDDSAVNRSVLKAMLTKLGVKDIALAEDGKLALATLDDQPPFDCVLSDMWMPVMDGAELVRTLRADPHYAALTVCSITADVEAVGTFKKQGFDDLLLKPVTLDKLRDLFSRLATK